jgi:hypothetical protein
MCCAVPFKRPCFGFLLDIRTFFLVSSFIYTEVRNYFFQQQIQELEPLFLFVEINSNVIHFFCSEHLPVLLLLRSSRFFCVGLSLVIAQSRYLVCRSGENLRNKNKDRLMMICTVLKFIFGQFENPLLGSWSTLSLSNYI